MTAPTGEPQAEKQAMHPSEGKPIKPALQDVGFIGQDNLDEVLDSGQSHLDFMAEGDGEQPQQEPGPDSTEEQPAATTEQAPTEGAEGEERIELPEHVTLEQLEEHNPALAKVYKSMQADYTRKTQALAEQRRELSDADQKAQWWDQLNGNPELVNHIRAYVEQRENGVPQQPVPAQQPQAEDYNPELDDLDLDPGQRSAVQRLIKDVIETEVRPYVEDLYAREVNRELETLKTDIPGFEENYEAIKQHRISGSNRQTWREAARDYLFDKQREMGMREAMEAMSKKKRVSSISEPPTGVVPPKTAPQSVPDTPTLDQALDIALGRHGIEQ